MYWWQIKLMLKNSSQTTQRVPKISHSLLLMIKHKEVLVNTGDELMLFLKLIKIGTTRQCLWVQGKKHCLSLVQLSIILNMV